MGTKWTVLIVAASLIVGFAVGKEHREPRRSQPSPSWQGDITVVRLNRPDQTGVPARFHPFTHAVGGKSITLDAPPEDIADVWYIKVGDHTFGAVSVKE